MIDKLQALLPEFAGREGHTRCFLHTTNLVAKSLISQFDVKKRSTIESESSDGSGNIGEEQETIFKATVENTSAGDEDNADGLVDERDNMSPSERSAHEVAIRPVQLVLAKVSIIIGNAPLSS